MVKTFAACILLLLGGMLVGSKPSFATVIGGMSLMRGVEAAGNNEILQSSPAGSNTLTPVLPADAGAESFSTQTVSTVVHVSPSANVGAIGTPITVAVAISDVTDLGSFEFTLVYSPSLVTVEGIQKGSFPESSGRSLTAVGPSINNSTGTASFGGFSMGSSPAGPNGSGALAYVRLLPLAEGTAQLHLSRAQITNVPGETIQTTILDGTLTVSSASGAVAAAFNANPLSGTSPLTVTFTNQSSGDFDASAWSFGNGMTSTITNPVYTYTDPGVYTVSLTVSGAGGTDTLTRSGYITVTSSPTDTTVMSIDPTASSAYVSTPVTVAIAISDVTNLGSFEFTMVYSPSLVTVENVQLGSFPGSTGRSFTAVGPNINNITGTVSFGAFSMGSSPVGASGSGIIAYLRLLPVGTGTALLHLSRGQVTNVPGETISLDRQDGMLSISPAPVAPVAAFTGSPISGTSPLTVTFTNQSSGDISNSLWSFGDGLTSTIGSPVHVYANPGIYTVTLTVTGEGGSDIHTRTNYITVHEAVIADFVGSPRTGFAPLTVVFTDTSTGPVGSWQWNFGDGTTSTLRNPTHTYSAAGTFSVSLTVSGPGGTNTKVRNSYISVSGVATTEGLVQPGAGGTITTTTGVGMSFPPGAVSETVAVSVVPTDPGSVGGNLRAVGRAFNIEARKADGTLVTSFYQPFTITIHYSDADAAGIDENSLKLFYRDGSGNWVEIPTTVDPVANTITGVLDHLTRFAILGQPIQVQTEWKIYLPVLLRGYGGGW